MSFNAGFQKIYPLSPMQQGMLFHHLLDPTSTAYFEQILMTLSGYLDERVFVESMDRIMQRHEVLRTVFVYEKVQKPLQVVLKQRKAEVKIEDISGLSEPEQRLALQRFREEDKARGFDLSADVLIRVTLFKTTPNSTAAVWSFHHILMDGWCLGIILQDFMTIYRMLQNKLEPVLDPVYPYSRFIEWLEKRDQEEAADYWNRYLEGYEQHVTLPSDGKAVNLEYRHEELTFKLDPGITRRLEQFAGHHQTTLNTVVQALWAVLLGKYNRIRDVVFGAVVSGRPSEIAHVERIVGLFINTVPVRFRWDENTLFSDMLKEAGHRALESSRYDYYSLADIQTAGGWKEGLFNHLVVFENYPFEQQLDESGSADVNTLTVTKAEFDEHTNYDFTLLLSEGDGLNVKFSYNSLVYSKEGLEQVAAHLLESIRQVAENPGLCVDDIFLLSGEEEQLLRGWNQTEAPYPQGRTMHSLFEEQARLTPDKTAVVLGKASLTYRELNERANRLARTLRRKGAGSDQIVAILVERSLEMMVSLFAIWKAGGGYMPIDPHFPEDRIGYMLEDSGAQLLLTLPTFVERVPGEYEGELLLLDDESQYDADGADMELSCSSHHLAYVIYTSGSTGRPKGVMIEHESVVNRIHWMQKSYPLGENDVVLQKTPYTFDVSVWELFWWSTVGASVCLLVPGGEKDPGELVETILRGQVTTMHFVPSMMNAFLDYFGEHGITESLSGLRRVFTSGEALPLPQVETFNRKLYAPNGTELVNLYGPTEATVDVTYFDCSPGEGMDRVPIGKPIDNIRLYIIDEQLRLQPIGVAGELCIAGVGLARGYVNKPELTAEKFAVNPYEPGGRLYRTGDLARWLPDGNIEYLGRIDHQVKIRGYRIELGEIESVLQQHGLIKEAAVIARTDLGEQVELCAYVAASEPLVWSELRAHLGAKLPEYMVPLRFVQLERMPLTVSGKLDRRALPKPDGSVQTGTAYVEPVTETEKKLTILWQELLRVDRVGNHDRFFDLGGHSLKATVLVSRIHKEFDKLLQLRTVFQHPTIAELSRVLDGGVEDTFVSIPRAEEADVYPLAAAQKRMYVMNRLQPDDVSYNMPGCMEIAGKVDAEKLNAAFQAILARHESLRTSFEMAGEHPVQRVWPELKLDLVYRQADEESAESLQRGWVKPFDLSKAPLLRAELCSIAPGRHLLLIDMHHIISDGVSQSILFTELAALYRGEILPEPATQYKDYAVWQNSQLQQEAYKESETYWLARYEDSVPVLQLPTDKPRVSLQEASGAALNFSLDSELTARLRQLALETGTTLYMVLLSAYYILLAKYSRQDDFVIGASVAGREHPDVESLVGMFVSTLALRGKPQSKLTYRQWLDEVKDCTLSALEHSSYPFEELVRQLDMERDSSRHPMFDTLFVLQNMDFDAVLPADMPWKLVKSETNSAKFDLTLEAMEQHDGLSLSFEYRTNLFVEGTIRQMASHYMAILEQVSARPELQLGQIQLLSAAEEEQLLRVWNQTEAAYPLGRTMHSLFEEQARLTPDKTAVVFGEASLTFRELNERANRLARTLQRKGAGADQIVAILIERSLEMMVGLFAIWKAGGAYMPIDPHFPVDRIDYMLEDCGAQLLLTLPEFMERVPGEYGGELLLLDDESQYDADSADIEESCSSHHLAYVIYTSGSTGRPKGVMIEHESVVNRIHWMQKAYPLLETDVILQKTPFTFDVSVWELFWWSTVGVTVCLLEPGGEKDPGVIVETIRRGRVTTMHFVPSMMNAFLDYVGAHGSEGSLSGLRRVFTSGEALPLPQVETFNRLLHAPNGTELVNMYGPTEATVDVTYFDCSPGEGLDRVPIGKPIDNIRMYILDEEMRMQPIGVAGELCIAGVGLARGYMNKPELTAEKFAVNPYEPSGRLYRTGDLSRWMPDGNIEYLGRIDHQVKIRGYRIELGEIESVLLQHEKVREAAVIARTDLGKQAELCAYVAANESLEWSELRAHLGVKLPEYMVPSRFVLLDRMPLTVSGKLDRRALPKPDGSAVEHILYVQARNEKEGILVQVWEDVLGHGPIGIHAHFLESGGDSIKAIQVASRLHRNGYQLDLKTMFQLPTIAQVAVHLKPLTLEVDQKKVIGEVKLTPIQQWFFSRELLDAHHWNQAVILHAPEGLDRTNVRQAFAALFDHHDALRTVFTADEEANHLYPKAFIREMSEHLDDFFELEVLDVTGGENVEERVEAEANRIQGSLNISEGPLCRIALFHTEQGDHLLIVIHHLLIDGVSWRILLEDLTLALSHDMKSALPHFSAKTTSYQAWAEHLHTYAESPKLLKEITYWHNVEQLETQALPIDSQVGSMTAADREVAVIKLTSRETQRLLHMTQRAYNTEINDLLLTALSRGLRAWEGLSRVVIDMEGHGRERIGKRTDTTRTIGWFTSMYPVVLDITETDDIGEQVKRIKETLRCIPNKGIGYGILKYITKPEHRQGLSFRKQPEIIFNYLGDIGSGHDQGNLLLSRLPSGLTVSGRGNYSHRLEIIGMVHEGELQFFVHYNCLEYRVETMERLAACMQAELYAIIQHCAERQTPEVTASDAGCGWLSAEQFDTMQGFVKRHFSEAMIEKAYPLGPVQSGILFHTMMEPGSKAYIEQMTLEFVGKLDTNAFRGSFERIMQRHEMLRTVYIHEAVTAPLQLVLNQRELSLTVLDLTSLTPEEQAERIRSAETVELERGFDLSRDTLIRFVLLITSDNRFQVIWTHHHILMDGWCLNIIMKEFLELYEASRTGASVELATVQPYSQYLEWLDEQPEESAKMYWQSVLDGYEPPHAMLKWLQKSSPDLVSPYELEHEVISLEPKMTRSLERLAADRNVTLNTVMQTLWGIVLSKYNRLRDVVFGQIVSGRPAEMADVEQMVGLFIKTIPVRVSWEPDATFAELLTSVQASALEAASHDYIGLSGIQALSPLKQDLVDHIMVFENYPLDRLADPSASADDRLTITGIKTFEQTNYGVNFILVPGDELTLRLSYNARVFDPAMLRAALGHLRELALQAIARPDMTVAAMNLLSQAELEQVTIAFNNSKTDYPKDRTLADLFEEQVNLADDRTALIFHEKSWTYEELLKEADHLAHSLLKRGLQPGQVVGIVSDRSAETIIGILGIIRAGGAYLPLDPGYPQERLHFMITDSSAAMVITKLEYRNQVDFADPIIYEEALIQSCEAPLLAAAVRQPEGLAYIMYTSGSTGQPKGVMVTDRNVIRLVKNTDYVDFQSEDRILMTGAPVFDATTFEIWGALLNGLRLYVADEDTLLNVERLEDAISSNSISLMWLTSPLFNQMSLLKPDMFAGLRCLLIGGDALSPVHVRRVRDACANTRLINGYGPTENTTFTACFQIEGDYTNIPIGKPISNSTVYVTDEYGLPAPIGIPGELCAGGDGVSKGYINRAELTSETFVVNPFEPGSIMYKTGDLARWLPDGNLAYMGRMDRQVKIRGYRIETGEITNVLLQHTELTDALVVVRENATGQKELCVYYVPRKAVSSEELRAYAGERLPSYMVPSAWVSMERLPLNQNGKIDQGALPEPTFLLGTKAEYAEPRNEVERHLANIWSEVLGYDNIGIHDNYFDLGGDSIKAIQISSRLYQSGWKIDLKTLFRFPNIAALSPYLNPVDEHVSQAAVMGEVSLTPIQQWFFEGERIQPNHFNQSMMLFRREGFDVQAIRTAMDAIVSHHDILRATFRWEDGGVVQWIRELDQEIAAEQLYRFKEVNFTQQMEPSRLEELVGRESFKLQASFDLERGPLLALGLFHTAEGDHLLITSHHLVMDGVSWRILLEDFATAYRHAEQGKPFTLPMKTSSFQQWAEHVKVLAGSEVLRREISYWKRVEGAGTGTLQPDFNIEARMVKDMESYVLELSSEESGQVMREAHRAYHTEINDLLLTALGLSLREKCGQSTVLFELEGHGREDISQDINVTRTVGWFTAAYPVALSFEEGKDDLGCHLKKVKESMRRIPRKGMGYGLLKYMCPPEHRQGLRFELKPDVSFNYLGEFGGGRDNGEIILSPLSDYSGAPVSPDAQHPHRLTINGFTVNGAMRFTFSYHKGEFRSETIERLAEAFREQLVALAEHCIAREEAEKTPSDYGWSELSIDELQLLRGDIATFAPEAEIERIYPLSPLQEGLLFHALYDPSSLAYFEQLSFEGNLDAARFVRCFNALLNRHDILRTVFRHGHIDSPRPFQVVLNQRSLQVYAEDLRGLDTEGQERRIKEFREADRRAGFDLSKDMLMRFAVLQRADDMFEVVWSFHHILMDGWCLGILMKEFGHLYDQIDRVEEAISTLPPVRPYGDFIEWLERRDRDEAVKYWRQYLAGYSQLAVVPSFSAEEEQAGLNADEYEAHEFSFEPEMAVQLEAVARLYQTTLSTVLQTVWGLLLAKYNHATDVVFGTVVSGRPSDITGVETMVGLFINTIPVRVEFEPSNTFADVLRTMQLRALESAEHDWFPLAEMKSEQKAELFQHLFVFENYPMQQQVAVDNEGNGGGLHIRDVELFEQTNYDFNLLVLPEERMKVRLSYNTSRYNRAGALLVEGHFLRLIEAMISNPQRRIEELTMLSAEERKAVMAFNATETSFPQEATLDGLFAERAAQSPERVALEYGNQSLTYGELAAQAEQWALALTAQGVRHGDRVGLIAGRGFGSVVGMLAILQAGAVYVPIEPDYPGERQSHVAAHAQVRALLTDAEPVFDAGDLPVVRMDLPLAEGWAEAELPQTRSAEDLAYIIYTSGSTGLPKGVMIEHRSAVNLVHWVNETYDVGAEDRLLWVTSMCFDLSVYDVFGLLAAGGTVVVAEKEQVQEPRQLWELMVKRKITFWDSVPTTMNYFVQSLEEQGWTERQSELRLVFLSGDWIPVNLKDRLQAYFPQARVCGLGGATEAAVWSNSYPIEQIAAGQRSIPYGKPLANNEFYILDPFGELTPKGVAGELHIGGIGVARGYMNDEVKTEAAFVANPFRPGEKMYRTGDLGRLQQDGNMEFLGRKDQQVKVRGYRIELGEIEYWLMQHDKVREAVVVVRSEGGAAGQLCAYVVPEGDSEATAEELRAHLAKTLTDYMLPAYVTRLKELPLSANGKIDRKALPAPEGSRGAGTMVRPRTEMERKLSAIWTELLGLEEIGVSDDFFMLGGHSLLAATMAARITAELGVELPLPLVFRYATIEGLSARLEEARQLRGTPEHPETLLNDGGEGSPQVFCFPPIASYGLSYKRMAQALPEYTWHGFDFIPEEDRIAQYVEFIRTLQPEGPYRLFGYSSGGNLAFEVAKALEAEGETVSDVMLLDSLRKMSPEPQSLVELEQETELLMHVLEQSEYREFLKVPSIRNEVSGRITEYRIYLNELVNSGMIRASMHMIESVETQNADLWRGASTEQTLFYNGSGKHVDMLDGLHFEHNVCILKKILEIGVPEYV